MDYCRREEKKTSGDYYCGCYYKTSSLSQSIDEPPIGLIDVEREASDRENRTIDTTSKTNEHEWDLSGNMKLLSCGKGRKISVQNERLP